MPCCGHPRVALRAAYVLTLLVAASGSVRAQEQAGLRTDALTESEAESFRTFNDMSIDDLMSATVLAPAMVAQTAREAPGIITVITREELRLSGARDFIDVLRLIPGFDLGAAAAKSQSGRTGDRQSADFRRLSGLL